MTTIKNFIPNFDYPKRSETYCWLRSNNIDYRYRFHSGNDDADLIILDESDLIISDDHDLTLFYLRWGGK